MAVCKERREESLKKGVTLPEWQCKVLAACLRHDTPVSVRQAEAGNQQYRQANVTSLPLTCTLEFFITEMEAAPERGAMQNMCVAVQKTGQTRYDKAVCTLCMSCSMYCSN